MAAVVPAQDAKPPTPLFALLAERETGLWRPPALDRVGLCPKRCRSQRQPVLDRRQRLCSYRARSLCQLVKEDRARDVRISECRDIDPPFPGAEISCMAVDEVEDRSRVAAHAIALLPR